VAATKFGGGITAGQSKTQGGASAVRGGISLGQNHTVRATGGYGKKRVKPEPIGGDTGFGAGKDGLSHRICGGKEVSARLGEAGTVTGDAIGRARWKDPETGKHFPGRSFCVKKYHPGGKWEKGAGRSNHLNSREDYKSPGQDT